MFSIKRPAAIFLFTIYLLTQAAAPCWFVVQQLSHSFFSVVQQFKQSGEPLIALNIEASAFNKLQKEEGEIMLDGMLYDIEYTVTSGSKKILYLKKDTRETQWQQHGVSLSKLLHKQSHSKNTGLLRIRGMFIAFFYERPTLKGPGTYLEIENSYAVHFINNYIPPYPGISSPPPKS
jgi:hypothetical protein